MCQALCMAIKMQRLRGPGLVSHLNLSQEAEQQGILTLAQAGKQLGKLVNASPGRAHRDGFCVVSMNLSIE